MIVEHIGEALETIIYIVYILAWYYLDSIYTIYNNIIYIYICQTTGKHTSLD